MPTIRRPNRSQVRAALGAWSTFARPPDPENESPRGEPGAEGETEEINASKDAGPRAPILSAEDFTDRPDPCEAPR
jgi:hypothetical protein